MGKKHSQDNKWSRKRSNGLTNLLPNRFWTDLQTVQKMNKLFEWICNQFQRMNKIAKWMNKIFKRMRKLLEGINKIIKWIC